MKTALIILNYNNAADTVCCLESILRHNTAPVKYIVVDNASRIDELDTLRARMSEMFGKDFAYYDEASKAQTSLPGAVLVQTGANLGYARGNNVGLALAYADPDIQHVMILNNDILFVEDIVEPLIAKSRLLSDCAVISPVLFKKGLREIDLNCARRDTPVGVMIRQNFLHYLWRLQRKDAAAVYPRLFILSGADIAPDGTLRRSGEVEIQLPSGSCMLIDKRLMQSLGGFDPATFLYYEENILYRKILAAGRKNYLSLDCRCIHLGASTTQALPSSLGVVKAGCQSQRYYVQRYSGVSRALRLLHRVSSAFFMASFRLQKALGLKV